MDWFENVKIKSNKKFDSRYEVYSSDINNASNILNNELVDKIWKLNNIFAVKPDVSFFDKPAWITWDFRFSFYENKILITIPSYEKMFNPGKINKSVFDITDFRNYLKQINFILSINKTLF